MDTAEAYSNIVLSDLDAELAGLSSDGDIELDDKDFDMVGGKYVPRGSDSDDWSSSDD